MSKPQLTNPTNEQELREQIQSLLEHKPREDAPDTFWDNGDIRTTWTGIWLDAYGEWDEMPASKVYPITYFLSKDTEEWLIESIKSLITAHTNAEIAKTLERIEAATPDYSKMDSYNRSFLKAMYENTIGKAIQAERAKLKEVK